MKFKKAIYLATFFSVLKMHNKAISILEKNLSTLNNVREVSSIKIFIGMEYTEVKKYKEAVQYFNEGLFMVENELLDYHPDFPFILKIIHIYGDKADYIRWYNNFINRIPFDKKFENVLKKCDRPI